MSAAVLDTAMLRGQQTPRLQLSPPCVSNAAQDAVDVYGLTGNRLDEWQDLILRIGCGERADLTWASFENGVIVPRQNGKGEDINALCLASLFVWGNQVTVYAAHRLDTARATFRKIKALIEGTPDLARRCKPINDSDEAIELLGGARLEFRTRTAAGGRGLTGDLVILDEALELTAEQIAALVPIMLARPYAQLWYFSTVPQFGDQHLCGVRARVLAGAERLSWAEWGVDTGAALDDPQVLAAANPALNIRITLERLHDLRGILGDEKFSTECVGIWPEVSAGAALNPVTWKAMTDVTSRRGRRGPGADLVLSLDMTPSRGAGSIGMHAFRSDGLEHIQLVDFAPGVDWMVSRAGELAAAMDPALWVIDRRNGVFSLLRELAAVGIEVAEDPKKDLPRGSLLVLDAGEAGDAVGQFIDAFGRKPSVLRHVGQEPLDLAVANVRAKVGDAGQIGWARKLSEVDIGPVVTVTQARYGSLLWLARPVVKPLQKPWVV